MLFSKLFTFFSLFCKFFTHCITFLLKFYSNSFQLIDIQIICFVLKLFKPVGTLTNLSGFSFQQLNQLYQNLQHHLIIFQWHNWTSLILFYGVKFAKNLFILPNPDPIIKYRSTIIHKIFVTNCSFHVKQRTTGKVQYLFFKSFWPVSLKILFRQGDWTLGYHTIQLRHFPES